MVTRHGGWFGSAHRAPAVTPDPALWPPADFDALVAAFRVTGFRPGNAWYLNDAATPREGDMTIGAGLPPFGPEAKTLTR